MAESHVACVASTRTAGAFRNACGSSARAATPRRNWEGETGLERLEYLKFFDGPED